MYVADSAESDIPRSLNTNIDFSESIECSRATSNMNLNLNTVVKNTECRVLNGRKINLKVTVEVSYEVYENIQTDIVSNIEDNYNIQSLKKTVVINSLLGEGSEQVNVKENIILEDNESAQEILSANIEIINKDIKLSYNKILAKADARINIVYLNQENLVKVSNNLIPVTCFIDIDNLEETAECDIRYCIQNMDIKPNEDNTIFVELDLQVEATAYTNREIELIDDLYSPIVELQFNSMPISINQSLLNVNQDFLIRDTVKMKELEDVTIYNSVTTLLIENEVVTNDKLIITGMANVDILYLDNNTGRINATVINIPYEFSHDVSNVKNNGVINTEIEIVDTDCIIMPNGDIDVSIKTIFGINIMNSASINVLDEINVLEEINSNYSIIIYRIKKGDTLWKIAKRFNSTIDAIVEMNELTDYEENLTIGEQIYIPRYVGKYSQSA